MDEHLENLQRREREIIAHNEEILKSKYDFRKNLEKTRNDLINSIETLQEELRKCQSRITDITGVINEINVSNNARYRLSKTKSIEQYEAIKYSDDHYEWYDKNGIRCTHTTYCECI